MGALNLETPTYPTKYPPFQYSLRSHWLEKTNFPSSFLQLSSVRSTRISTSSAQESFVRHELGSVFFDKLSIDDLSSVIIYLLVFDRLLH